MVVVAATMKAAVGSSKIVLVVIKMVKLVVRQLEKLCYMVVVGVEVGVLE